MNPLLLSTNIYAALCQAPTGVSAAHLLAGVADAGTRLQVDADLMAALYRVDWEAANAYTDASKSGKEGLIYDLPPHDWSRVRAAFCRFAPDGQQYLHVAGNTGVVFDKAGAGISQNGSRAIGGVFSSASPKNGNIVLITAFQNTIAELRERARKEDGVVMDLNERKRFYREVRHLESCEVIPQELIQEARLVLLWHAMKSESSALIEQMIPLGKTTPEEFLKLANQLLQTFVAMTDPVQHTHDVQKLGPVLKLEKPLRSLQVLRDSAPYYFQDSRDLCPDQETIDLVNSRIQIALARLQDSRGPVETTRKVLQAFFG